MNIMSSNFLGFTTITTAATSTTTTTTTNKVVDDEVVIAEPPRDEVMDQSRDQDGESRDEEKSELHYRKQQHTNSTTSSSSNESGHNKNNNNHHDVSMFSTLTELLFNPFLDGYCKTPFCSDNDYLPPSCPSGGFYTTPQHHEAGDYYHEAGDYFSTSSTGKTRHNHLHQDDEYGDIHRTGSGASSGVSSNNNTHTHRRRHRQRPLALAVGYGDEWKDSEGRRVVITPSSSRLSPHRNHHLQQPQPHRSSPDYRYRVPAEPSACTCSGQVSSNSLMSSSPENNNSNRHDLSPHQTKSVICKYCSNRLRSLEVPASSSSGSIGRPPLI